MGKWVSESTSNPIHLIVGKTWSITVRAIPQDEQSERQRQTDRQRTQGKSTVFITSSRRRQLSIFHTLFIRTKSLSPAHSHWGGMRQGRKHLEVAATGGYLPHSHGHSHWCLKNKASSRLCDGNHSAEFPNWQATMALSAIFLPRVEELETHPVLAAFTSNKYIPGLQTRFIAKVCLMQFQGTPSRQSQVGSRIQKIHCHQHVFSNSTIGQAIAL